MLQVPSSVEGIELRIDLFLLVDLKALKEIKKKNLLFTLRSQEHGGRFSGPRQELLRALASCNPTFLDLEWDTDKELLTELTHNYPKIKIILSYHHLLSTPLCFDSLYQKMSIYPAFHYKIAIQVSSSLTSLQMLLWMKEHQKVSLLPLGEMGSFARILAPIFGSFLNYAYIDTPTGPGQLSIKELFSIYNYTNLSSKTKIFGLIGDPIEMSQGHLYHNALFQKQKQNAVYVKICLKEQELSVFFPLAKLIGIVGLSVTMPLKEKVLPFLDSLDADAIAIQAVNTLFFQRGKILGTNTDGLGAIKALEQKVILLNKKIAIFGAGGAARAIAYAAQKKGAFVYIINRTKTRALALTCSLSCTAVDVEEIPHDCTIWINCSPISKTPPPLPTTLIMDIVYYSLNSAFLMQAKNQGCVIIDGKKMFQNQAFLQNKFWNNFR